MAPSLSPFSSTRYSIVIDAGSSGSRLQIYSWQDPEAEREELIQNVRQRVFERIEREGTGGRGKGKGKGKQKETEEDVRMEVEREVEIALRRLVKVGKGVAGDDWVKKVEPGISSIPPSHIPTYLSPLLHHARTQIPPSLIKDTPIYVLATAGMRLLPEKEAEGILGAVCEELGGWGFDSGSDGGERGKVKGKGRCRDNVRIISGEEEGMWGWVAVNYLMDGFGYTSPGSTLDSGSGSGSTSSSSSRASSSSSTPRSEAELLPLQPLSTDNIGLSSSIPVTLVDPTHQSPTFGFLDMGGASTQIAFAPTLSEIEKSAFPVEELRSVSLKLLSGEVVEWPLFVASWLGFGTNRVRERYVEERVRGWKAGLEEAGNSGTTEKDSPTGLPKDLFLPVDDPCLPKDLILPSTSPSSPSFRGTGSFKQCLADLQPLLQADLPCPSPHSHCLFAGLPTPHIDFEREDQRGFIGISEYWYTAQQVLGVGGVWDWGEWEKGMSRFCARTWSDIEGEFAKDSKWMGSAIELSRLEMQCFKGAWISNVLHEGIGIPRMYDVGGNETLTGGPLGETNEEAERRAKEKGLMSGSHKHPSHFQSLDHVGETAISWTLGKMVIEASRGVRSHGHLEAPVGTSRTWRGAWSSRMNTYKQALGFDGFSGRIAGTDVPPVPLVFGLIASLLLLGIWLAVRKRPGSRGGRQRKSSDVGPGGDYVKSDGSGSESGIGLASGLRSPGSYGNRSRPFGIGRLKLLGNKWASIARNILGTAQGADYRTRHPRQGLSLQPMNYRDPYPNSTPGASQPSSPRYFVPALALHNDENRPPTTMSATSDQTTPRPGDFLDPEGPFTPRSHRPNINTSGIGHKSSLTNLRSKRNSPAPLSPSNLPNTSGGWNDPPINAFTASNDGQESFGTSSVLAPYVSGGGEATISRDPSRVSLVEYARGLSSRPMSRTSMHNDEGD